MHPLKQSRPASSNSWLATSSKTSRERKNSSTDHFHDSVVSRMAKTSISPSCLLLLVLLLGGVVGGARLAFQGGAVGETHALPDDHENQVALRIQDEEFEKFAKDTRKFAYLELTNGARAYVVSDREAPKAQIELSFNAGHSADPPDSPGIAHLLEHCALALPRGVWLFNSTSFPGFISGENTSPWRTSYPLAVEPRDLKRALGVMTDALVNPIYDTTTVDVEMKRVYLEHFTRVNDGLSLLTISAYFDHKLAVREVPEFLDFPSSELYRRIREFQSRYYTSDHAVMMLVGHQPVAELEALAVEALSKFKRGVVEDAVDLQEKARSEKWISTEKLGKQIMHSQWNEDSFRGLSYVFPISGCKKQFKLAAKLLKKVLKKSCTHRKSAFIEDNFGEALLEIWSAGDSENDLAIQQIGDEIFSAIHFLRQQEAPVWWADDRVRAFESRKRTEMKPSLKGLPLFDKRFRVREFPLANQKPVPFNAEEWRAFLDIFDVDKMIVRTRGEGWRDKCDKKLDRDAGVWGVKELNPEWKKSWKRHLDGEERLPGYDDIVMPPRLNFLSTSADVKPMDPPVRRASDDDDVPVKVPVADSAMSDKLDLYWWQPQDRKSSQVALYFRISLPHLDGNAADFEEARKFCGIYNAAFRRLAAASKRDLEVKCLAHPDGAIDAEMHAEADVMPKLLRSALLFLTGARVKAEELNEHPTDNPMTSEIGNMYETKTAEYYVSGTDEGIFSMMKRYNMEVVPAAKSHEYFQGLVDGTVTPPAPPKIFSHAHVQMVAGGNLLLAEAQRFAADVVNMLGIKEGCPPAPVRHAPLKFKDLFDETGRPLRIEKKFAWFRDDGAEAVLTVVFGDQSDEMHAVFDVARKVLRDSVIAYFSDPGEGKTAIAYHHNGYASISSELAMANVRIVGSYHPDKITQHLPEAFATVMTRVDEQTDEDWFNKRKKDLLAEYRRAYAQESPVDKTWRFFQQLRRRRPFIAMPMPEAGLRKLTFARYKEIIRSYAKCPWILSQYGGVRRAGKQDDYPSPLSPDSSGSEWIRIGRGRKWMRSHVVGRHFAAMKKR